ncbi:MAG: hypothetical protein CMD18_08615 [Flavobacteriales bacterium]|nr:hypothetical protein [Flavobacteriales bacterium]
MNKFFLSIILFWSCSAFKEKQKLEEVQQKQSVNIEKPRLDNFIIDSTNLNSAIESPINKGKQSTNLSIEKPEYTFGIVADKSKTSGCSFVILTKDSLVFEPFNLEEKFKIDGLEIIFKYKKSRAMTTCMMGQTIVVSQVKPFRQKN